MSDVFQPETKVKDSGSPKRSKTCRFTACTFGGFNTSGIGFIE
jgi:hypothetical protein